MSDTKLFPASEGWLHRFRNRLGLKNIKKNIGGAKPTDEEATVLFPAELKKLIKKRDHIHIIFITVQCYKCSIFLLATIVNFSPCLICKLSFVIGIYRRKHSLFLVFGTIQDFRLKVLENIPHG